MRKFALPLTECHNMGTSFATHDWSEEEVADWLLDQGYSTEGKTARRIQRAYFEQQQRDLKESA